MQQQTKKVRDTQSSCMTVTNVPNQSQRRRVRSTSYRRSKRSSSFSAKSKPLVADTWEQLLTMLGFVMSKSHSTNESLRCSSNPTANILNTSP